MANAPDRPDLSPEQQFIEQWYGSGGIHRSVLRQLLIYERQAATAGHLFPPGTYQAFLRERGGADVGEYFRKNQPPADSPARLSNYWTIVGAAQRGQDHMDAPAESQAPKDGEIQLNAADQVVNRYAWYLNFHNERNPLIKHTVLRALATAEQAQSASPDYRAGMFIDRILESAQQLKEQLIRKFEDERKEVWADEQQAQLEPRALLNNVLTNQNAPAGIPQGTWEALRLRELNEAPDMSWPPGYVTTQAEEKKDKSQARDNGESSSSSHPAPPLEITTTMATELGALMLDQFGLNQPDLPRPASADRASSSEMPPRTADEIAAMTPAEIAALDQADLPLVEVAEFEALTNAQQVEYLYKRIGATLRRDTLAKLRDIERRNGLPAEGLLEWLQSYRAVVLANDRPEFAPPAVTPAIWAEMRRRLNSLPADSRRPIAEGALISMTTEAEQQAVHQILDELEKEHNEPLDQQLADLDEQIANLQEPPENLAQRRAEIAEQRSDLEQRRLPEGILLRRLYTFNIFNNEQPPHNAPAPITNDVWNGLRELRRKDPLPPPGAAQLTLRQTPLQLDDAQGKELNQILARPELPFNRAVMGAMIEIAAESNPNDDPLRILKWSLAEWDSRAMLRRYGGIEEAGSVLTMTEEQIRSTHGYDPAFLTYLKQLKTLQASSPPTTIIPLSPLRSVEQSSRRKTPPLLNDAQHGELNQILARPDLPFNPAVVGTMIKIAAESDPNADPLRILKWSLEEWDAVAELRDPILWPDAGNVLTKTEEQIKSRQGYDPAFLTQLEQLKLLQASPPPTTTIPLPADKAQQPTANKNHTVEEIYKKSVQEFQYETVRKFARIMSMPETGGERKRIINGYISAYNRYTNGSLGSQKLPQSTFQPPHEDMLRLMRVVEAATVGDDRTLYKIVSPLLNKKLAAIEPFTIAMSTNEIMAMQGDISFTPQQSTPYIHMVDYLRNEGHHWDSQDTYLANKSNTWKTFLTTEYISRINDLAKMFSVLEKGFVAFPFDRTNPDEANQEREFVQALKTYIHHFEPTRLKNQTLNEWGESVRKWKDLQHQTSLEGYQGALGRVGNQFSHEGDGHAHMNSAQRLNVARALISVEYRTGKLQFAESAVAQRRDAKESVVRVREEIDEAAKSLSQANNNTPRIVLHGGSIQQRNSLNVPSTAAAQIQNMITILVTNMTQAIEQMQREFQIQKRPDGTDENQNYRNAPVYVQARVPTRNVKEPSNSIWMLHNFIQKAFGADSIQFSNVSAQLEDMLNKKIYVRAGSGAKFVGGLTGRNPGFRKVNNQQEELTGKMLKDCQILLEAVQRIQTNSPADQMEGWNNVLKPYVEKMNQTAVTELFNQRVHRSNEHLDQSDHAAVDQRFPRNKPTLSVLVQPVAAPNTHVKGQAFRMTMDESVLIEPKMQPHGDHVVHVVPKNLAATVLKPEVMSQLKMNRDERNKDPSIPAKVIDVQFTLKPTLATRIINKVKQVKGKFRS